MEEYTIDGIKLDIPNSMSEMQQIMEKLLESDNNTISFINPEIFLNAKKNLFLKEYLSETKYNFVDGIGLLMAVNNAFPEVKYTSNDRYTGTEFFSYLGSNRKWKVFLLGATKENNELAARNISNSYSNVDVVGNIDGYSQLSTKQIVEKINGSNADVLIVCLGFPKQEKWIKDNLNELNVKIVFGNGGGIDFWSGKIKRAPEFMIRANLEWLFRLFQDFNIKRIRRQARLIPFALRSKRNKYEIKREDR